MQNDTKWQDDPDVGDVTANNGDKNGAKLGQKCNKCANCAINNAWTVVEKFLLKVEPYVKNNTRNTLNCDQSNVYSSRVVFSAIS